MLTAIIPRWHHLYVNVGLTEPKENKLALVLARAVDDLAGGDLLQVPAVDRLAVGLRGLLEPGGRDPAVLPGDLLGDGHRQVL